MAITSEDLPYLVFERAIDADRQNVSLDGHMLAVLTELDGNKNLAAVSKRTGMGLEDVARIVVKLRKMGLVNVVKTGVKMMDRGFIDFLRIKLSKAVGPIAEILLEEASSDLGIDLEHMPLHKAPELVEALAADINREEQRIEFQQAMLAKIKEHS